jgi:predicted RNase H-like HicB family nuclease
MTKTTTQTYTAKFSLDNGTWLAEIVEIPEVHTFGRTLGKAQEYILDALALWLDEPIDTVRPRVVFNVPDLPDEIRSSVQLAVGARAVAEGVNKEAAELMTAAASALVRDGHLSIRDASDILGISHQRVHQILPDADRAVGKAAELRARQGEAAQALAKYFEQRGIAAATFVPFEDLMKDDALARIGILLIGGAILALTAGRR